MPPLSSNSTVPSGDALPEIRTALPGPRASALCELLAQYECPALTARRKRRSEQSGAPHDPIVWQSARGANVCDVDGNLYVDMTAGFGAALIGHGDPQVVSAVQQQASVLMHALGDVHPSEPKIALEKKLASLVPFADARVILGLSGSDAVEAALKTCVLRTKASIIVAFHGSYHGLSHGPLAACGYSPAFREPFQGQLGNHVRFVTYPSLGDTQACERSYEQLCTVLDEQKVGVILIEPILGRGGVIRPDPKTVRAMMDRAVNDHIPIIVDEIYTGMKRAGEGFTFWESLVGRAPDIVCFGKALGGGMPISACVMGPESARAWGNPDREAIHTSTFLGNPLACTAALATLDVLQSPETDQRLREVTDDLWTPLEALLSQRSLGITRLDGARLLIGVGLSGGSARTLAVVRAMLEQGYILLPGGVKGDALTLTPPMTLTREQCQHFAQTLEQVLARVP
jgi:4-aminobutyrate aminotransferase / (S)-3-amino-2-methylpropionate transaminase / 5-aminovalerate transaminase